MWASIRTCTFRTCTSIGRWGVTTAEPQSRVSGRWRSPPRKESPQRRKGKKTTAEVKNPNDLPEAKKHKHMDWDEDDEPPKNEPDRSNLLPVHKVSSQEHRPIQVLRMSRLRSNTECTDQGRTLDIDTRSTQVCSCSQIWFGDCGKRSCKELIVEL